MDSKVNSQLASDQIRDLQLVSEFLTHGAFVKDTAEKITVLIGPFKKVTQREDYHLCSQYFFDSELSFFQAVGGIQELPLSEFMEMLLEYQSKEGYCTELPLNFLNDANWITSDFSQFREVFEQIQIEISQGKLLKAVPTISAKLPYCSLTREIKLQLLLNLLSHSGSQPLLFPYGYWSEIESWGLIGATPELLFSQNGDKVSSMALAGTGPLQADLLSDLKELKEHQIVVEDVIQSLKILGELSISEVEKIQLPTLCHLRTLIQLRLTTKVDISSLVDLLHPTAALGVFPRNKGHRWLLNLPGQRNRKFFGSPLVFHKAQDQNLAIVCIRNIEWDSENSIVTTGCGVISESLLQKEWNELVMKRKSVLKFFSSISR